LDIWNKHLMWNEIIITFDKKRESFKTKMNNSIVWEF